MPAFDTTPISGEVLQELREAHQQLGVVAMEPSARERAAEAARQEGTRTRRHLVQAAALGVALAADTCTPLSISMARIDGAPPDELDQMFVGASNVLRVVSSEVLGITRDGSAEERIGRTDALRLSDVCLISHVVTQ